MKFREYDVIIVGTGVSGLYAALNLNPRFNILMLSKKELSLCNSALAQGGVAAVIDTENDNFDLHIKDTLIAGGYENNRQNLDILVHEGPTDIDRLLELGVSFDKRADGSIDLTLEGGHSRNRIAHHKDNTGFEIVSTLIGEVLKRPNITTLENAHLVGLIKEGDDFLFDVDFEGGHSYYTTKTCILATGGIGRVYDYTTNSPVATGDGIYFAYNMGAKVEKLSLVQFHPTAFADKENKERFLISESVRGEGAYLLNCDMERFMPRYEPERKELAPRDVVSRCIMEEEKRTGSNKFYLDISHMDGDFVASRFPMIYAWVREKGYDMAKEPIPVYPCQHYLMGGISVDKNGRSTVKGLYAAGECAHTGIHGKNRLASNSLLEALVFSRLVALDVNSHIIPRGEYGELHFPDYPEPVGEPAPRAVRDEMKEIIQRCYFVTPNYDECRRSLPRIKEINAMLETGNYAPTTDFVETKSLAVIAKIILSELLGDNNK